jgi:antitoxin VapB
MKATKTTRTFKSGNSIALRLPKALGIEAGREMRVREEQGRYVVEPVEPEGAGGKIDLTGIWGSIPGLKSVVREGEEYEDIPREWHLLGLNPR